MAQQSIGFRVIYEWPMGSKVRAPVSAQVILTYTAPTGGQVRLATMTDTQGWAYFAFDDTLLKSPSAGGIIGDTINWTVRPNYRTFDGTVQRALTIMAGTCAILPGFAPGGSVVQDVTPRPNVFILATFNNGVLVRPTINDARPARKPGIMPVDTTLNTTNGSSTQGTITQPDGSTSPWQQGQDFTDYDPNVHKSITSYLLRMQFPVSSPWPSGK